MARWSLLYKSSSVLVWFFVALTNTVTKSNVEEKEFI